MKLTEPCTFFGLNLKNRIVRSATAERAADENGLIMPPYLDIYDNVAMGGAGLIITGHAFVAPGGKNTPAMTGIHDDSVIPGLLRMTERVHRKPGVAVVMQISHSGRQTQYTPKGLPPMAPSAVPAPSCPAPHEMTEDETLNLVRKFIEAGARAQKSGFDGVQLHGAHGYLISQFVSPYTNRRTDSFGGSYENRLRFAKDIIQGVREKTGATFPVLIKWNSEDFVEGGLTRDESERMVFDMEAAGLSGIEISGGIFESASKICRRHIKKPEDEGYFAAFAERLKKNGLKIPVMLVGGFKSAATAENALEKGWADLISFCRPIIHDPGFPNRMAADPSHKSTCLSCNTCLRKREGVTRCHRE
jgi:2,4-dienoyl-CoA reductase-like NADH-dependent reductase (Old Yellow Enzyme family)